MTKDELRQCIESYFCNCITKGRADFTLRARKEMTLTFTRGLTWVVLSNDGIILSVDSIHYTVEEAIDIFTNFVWTTWFDYQD